MPPPSHHRPQHREVSSRPGPIEELSHSSSSPPSGPSLPFHHRIYIPSHPPAEIPSTHAKPARYLPAMALGVSSTMALLLLSLVTLSHFGALQVQADSAANAVVPAKVHAAADAEGLLRLPSSVAEPDPDRSLVEPVAEPDPDRSPVEPVAEPDPDRSPVEPVAEPDPDQSSVEPCSEGQQGDEKVKKEQIDDEDKDEEEKEKANSKKEGKKKTKKHQHDGDGKGKKKEKAEKRHRQSDDEDEEEEESSTKKRVHRHHRAEESAKKKNKLLRHIRNNDSGDDDSDDEEEKKAKRWRKAIKTWFGHGRRSQREEADTEEVND